MACYVIGGLIFNVSWASTTFGLLCASFTACAGVTARVWLTPFMLPTGPVAWGVSAFLFSCVRFHKTFMMPVELAEMTVPEDHLFQRLMARKVMGDVVTSLNPRGEAEHDADPQALMSRPRYLLTNAWLNVISYGAYGLHTFAPASAAQCTFRGMTYEELAQVEPPTATLTLLLDIYAKLKQNDDAPWTDQMGGDANSAHEKNFQEAIFAFLLLVGLRRPSKVDLEIFQTRWVVILNEHFAAHFHAGTATREVFFVFFLLTAIRDRQLQRQMMTFFKFADKDDSNYLDLSEFNKQANLAYPGKAWVDEVVNELYARDGQLGPRELSDIAFKRNPERWVAVLKALPRRVAAIKASKVGTLEEASKAVRRKVRKYMVAPATTKSTQEETMYVQEM